MLTKTLAEQWRKFLAPQEQQAQAQVEPLQRRLDFIRGGRQMAEFIRDGVRPAKERPEPPRDPAGAQTTKAEPPVPQVPPGRQPPDKGTKGVEDRDDPGGASPSVNSTATEGNRP